MDPSRVIIQALSAFRLASCFRNFIESFQFPDHFLQIFLGQCCRLRQLVYEQTNVLEDPHPLSMFLQIKYEMNRQYCCSKKKAESCSVKYCFRLQVIQPEYGSENGHKSKENRT